MSAIKRKEFDFQLPDVINAMIDELDTAVAAKATYVDCIQDEIRALAHGCTDDTITEEQAEEIIDYYCRRRF